MILFKFFKYLWLRLKFRLFYYNKRKLTPKGKCLIRYCVDKYVNLRQIDKISEYENEITHFSNTAAFNDYYIIMFPKRMETEELENERIHAIAAIMRTIISMSALIPSEKE